MRCKPAHLVLIISSNFQVFPRLPCKKVTKLSSHLGCLAGHILRAEHSVSETLLPFFFFPSFFNFSLSLYPFLATLLFIRFFHPAINMLYIDFSSCNLCDLFITFYILLFCVWILEFSPCMLVSSVNKNNFILSFQFG